MKLKNILLALIPCMMALACKKEDVLLFNSEMSGIYFRSEGIIHMDSLEFSFSSLPSTKMDTIVRRRVVTMGKVRDYPRPVKFSVDQALSTAVEGKHYEIDYNSAIIPAGEAEAYIRVKFKRTEDMSKKSFNLDLKLEDNEHFNVYMEKQRNNSVYSRTGWQLNADRYRFIVDDIYSEPSRWISTSSYFGRSWTAKKYKYINSVLGWTHEDWLNTGSSSPISSGVLDAAALLVRNSLQALADAGTPMLDEDGLGMQLTGRYLVKY